jgi:hypothetical protein
MFFLRWIPTFLAFPLAGEAVALIVGLNRTPLTALSAGAILGGFVGVAQWLALGRAVDWRWAAGTLAAVAAGSTVSMLAVGPPVGVVPATVTGLIAGTAAGAVQSIVLRRGPRVGVIWSATVALSWAGAWALTSAVLRDSDPSHAVFGSGGALAVTVVTGIVLRVILDGRRWGAPPGTESTRSIEAAAAVIAATRPARRAGRD